jgi:predicted permease
MTDLLQDLRYAVRQIGRTPGFSAAAVATLALGIGVTTTLFVAVEALVLRPLPVAEPASVVEVRARVEEGSPITDLTRFSYPQFETLRAAAPGFESLAGWTSTPVDVGTGAITLQATAAFVTGDFFPMLGVAAAAGRLIDGRDDRRGEPGGVVLSHRLWQTRFGGDPAAVGSTVRINGTPVAVVGIAPPELRGLAIGEPADLWAPLALHPVVVPNSGVYGPMSFGIAAVGRLASAAPRELVQERASAAARLSNEQAGGPVRLAGVELRTMSRVPARSEAGVHRFLALLAATTALVLLIAAVNVGGMLLVRGSSRAREVGIRFALGARRGRVVRQLLVEGAVLVGGGAVAGLLVAAWLVELVAAFRWPMEVTLDAGLSPRVLLFAAGTALLTALVCALLPALHASRVDLRSVIARRTETARWGAHGLRRLFVVLQVAMSVVLLACAGLFLRSLHEALSTDPGFNPDGVLVARLDLRRQQRDESQERALYARILQEVEQTPGVRTASLSAAVPLGPGGEIIRLRPAESEEEARMISSNLVSPDYFATLGTRLLSGRLLGENDRADAPPVAVLSESAARELWPGQDPIGKQLRKEWSAMQMLAGLAAGDPVSFEVVGVVADGMYDTLGEEPRPHVYLPLAQEHRSRVVLALRAERGSQLAAVAGRVQERVHALDASLPLLEPAPLRALIGDQILAQRLGATLTTLFGALGLFLAAIGLYGVLAFGVARETREIGIRMALGARAGRVVREVLRGALALVLIGAAAGVGAALLTTRLLEAFLFGVAPTDPVALVGATLLLLLVAGAAAWIPARRAATVDPMVALRMD